MDETTQSKKIERIRSHFELIKMEFGASGAGEMMIFVRCRNDAYDHWQNKL